MLALLAAGLLAGGVNAVAGGGSLISFPALLALGLPPLTANVSNTVALWPGYVGTVYGYRTELRTQLERLRQLVPTSLVGAGVGCALLLLTPASSFEAVVPYLVIGGSLLLALQGRVAKRASPHRGSARTLQLTVGLAAVYGAYFGGGLGVILLACLGFVLADGLQTLNGLKSALSLVINAVALLAFSLFGPVDWSSVVVLAPAALVGGYLGAGIARRLAPDRLRAVVVVFGVVVGVVLLVR